MDGKSENMMTSSVSTYQQFTTYHKVPVGTKVGKVLATYVLVNTSGRTEPSRPTDRHRGISRVAFSDD